MTRTFSIGCVLTASVLAAELGCSGKPAAPTVPAKPATVPVPADFGLPPEIATATTYGPQPKGTLTFTKHIAPIIYQKCAACHRAGEIAPFSLLTYEDVRKRARQIVEVTRSRLMPPWSAVPGYNDFAEDRSLSTDQVGMLGQWVAEGTVEGDPADLAPRPAFRTGWRYGQPDLVVAMPEPYELAPAGTDRFRTFVIPVPISETKYVRAFDLDPGNPRVAHHAVVRLRRARSPRYADGLVPQTGSTSTFYEGRDPDGFYLGWTPGYKRAVEKTNLTWKLEPGTDLLLDLHLNATGKPERLQSRIALYFSDRPSPAHPELIKLENQVIDLPPDRNDVVVEDSFVVPVNAQILSIYPHAHFICKDMKVFAIRPDGTKVWLLRIADWDFNWQNVYTYKQPMAIPRGTKLVMHYTYDNSAGNPRNPHHPPQRVRFGPGSREEMGNLVLQVLLHDESDSTTLKQTMAAKIAQNDIARDLFHLTLAPRDAEAHYNLGSNYSALGDMAQAMDHYEEAIRLAPDNVFARNNLGNLYRLSGQLDAAKQQFGELLRINAQNPVAHDNLGLVYLQQNDLKHAAAEFEEALRIAPDFADAECNFGFVALAGHDLKKAAEYFERACNHDPSCELAHRNLLMVREQLGGAR